LKPTGEIRSKRGQNEARLIAKTKEGHGKLRSRNHKKKGGKEKRRKRKPWAPQRRRVGDHETGKEGKGKPKRRFFHG